MPGYISRYRIDILRIWNAHLLPRVGGEYACYRHTIKAGG